MALGRPLAVGESTTFPNDLTTRYGNNDGRLTVTVTRTS